MPMTNAGNRDIYRRWAPVYDLIFDRRLAAIRQDSVALLAPLPGERILLSGVGTGADVRWFPAGVHITGLDLSPQMLQHAKRKPLQPGSYLSLVCADAMRLPLQPGVFDGALLSLIVSVAPDGAKCFEQAWQAIRPGGRLVIFDKFQQSDHAVSPLKGIFNRITQSLGTDVTRTLESITSRSPDKQETSLFGGAYRFLLFRK